MFRSKKDDPAQTFEKVREYMDARIAFYRESGISEDQANKLAVDEMTQIFEDPEQMIVTQKKWDLYAEQLKKEKPIFDKPTRVPIPISLNPKEWKEYVWNWLLKGDIYPFIEYWLERNERSIPDIPNPNIPLDQVKEALDKRNPQALRVLWGKIAKYVGATLATGILTAAASEYLTAKNKKRESLETTLSADPTVFFIRLINPQMNEEMEKNAQKIINNVMSTKLRWHHEVDDPKASRVLIRGDTVVTRDILKGVQYAIVDALAKKGYASVSDKSPRNIQTIEKSPAIIVHLRDKGDTSRSISERSGGSSRSSLNRSMSASLNRSRRD